MKIFNRKVLISGNRAIQGYAILCIMMLNASFTWSFGDFHKSITSTPPVGSVDARHYPDHNLNPGEKSNKLYQIEITDEPSEETGFLDSNIRFEQISIEHGLSQSSVYSIFQDQKGFLWFGTEDGLNKYDGYSFTIYRHDPDDPYSLSDNSVLSIHEDQLGVMWIGTYGRGLNRFDRENERFIRFRHNPSDPSSLSYDTVSAITSDSSGNLWVGTLNGLDRLDAETGKFIHYKHDLEDPATISHDTITALHWDDNGILWIGTYGGGLNKYDPSSEQFQHYRHDIVNPDRLSSDYITSICEDKFGNLWIATADRGLNKFDPQTKKFTQIEINSSPPEDTIHNTLTSVDVDQSGNVWIGTTDVGIDVLNPISGENQNFQKILGDPFSLSQNQVNTIFVDSSGIVWIGTFGGGINKFDPTKARFTNYRHIPGNPDSLSGKSVMSIAGDDEGNLWVGMHEGGLNFINRNTGEVTHFFYNSEDTISLSDEDVWGVHQDQSDNLWIAMQGDGLYQFDLNSGDFNHFVNDPDDLDSLSINSVNELYEDRNGIIWIGTNGGGLERFDEKTGKFIHYRHNPDDPQSLSSNRIWSISEDRSGKLWIGTGGGGISVLDQETGKFLRHEHDPDNPNSLGDTDIFSIFEDSRGRIWIGTYGSGLDKYIPETDEFIHYRVNDGLPNNVVYGILEDEQDFLWLSTNLGLSRFDPQSETFKNFDASDGLQSNEFNVGAYLIDDFGDLYFGGINGLTTFHPDDIQETTYLPPVVFTGFRQSGEEIVHESAIDNLNEIVLEWPNNNFEFEYVALNYSQPEKSQYAYQLEGFDEDWNMVGTNRNGRYTNLPGGTYTLMLRATNSDGIWNEDGTSIQVKVVPPFWATLWFIAIVTLIVIAGVFSGFRMRIRSVESRSQELEDEVKSRIMEIDQRRLELEALYQADEVIDQNLTLENRLKALVDVSIDILHADKSSIFVWDEGLEQFIVKAARGFKSNAIQTLTFNREEGIVGSTAQRGEPVFVSDGLDDPQQEIKLPEFLEIILAEGIRSYMFLPIKISNEIFGVFNVNFSEPNAIGEDEKRVFLALTQHSALSIQNAQLFEQLRELAISEERSRLARDLHDSAKQKAFAALAQLGAASGMIERDVNRTKDHLLEAEELVYEVLQELIILIQEMYPVTLKEKGLASLVREYIFDWENQCEIEADVKIVNERRLPLEIEQSLYRVIQESLANIARHSQAQKVKISIIFDSDYVEVQVKDDGIGFDLNQAQRGLGIRSMHERIEMIKGEMEIKSERGKGTLIKTVAPTHLKE
jgi:ligand-binding sensor domain-containing protein/signal transduction histidine kinase